MPVHATARRKRRILAALVPLEVFRERQFSGANAATFLIYGALGVVLFLLILVLQNSMGYSALQTGSSLLPVTIGALVAGAGLASGANAVARLAGLIATAVIPLAAGLGGMENPGGDPLLRGFRAAMWISAALCAGGGVVSWLTIRGRGEGRR